MLLSDEKEALVGRQLHAGDLLDVLGHHDEVNFADVGLGRVVVDVANRDVVACVQGRARQLRERKEMQTYRLGK